LKSHPNDAALLAALGHLCLTGQLWGQGEHYLLRSMALRSDVRIHALLGNLYDRLGRPDDAMKHWRLASGVTGALPVIEIARYLPAADTRADPTLIDVEQLPVAQMADVPFPVAASAADFTHDDFSSPADQARAKTATEPSHAAPQEAAESIDDYFDSAPIPGVDLSQTSDRSSRRD
jgi:HemY protein